LWGLLSLAVASLLLLLLETAGWSMVPWEGSKEKLMSKSEAEELGHLQSAFSQTHSLKTETKKKRQGKKANFLKLKLQKTII
jgi:hypothetical protein